MRQVNVFATLALAGVVSTATIESTLSASDLCGNSFACPTDAPGCSTSDLSPLQGPTPTGELQSAITSWLNREPDCTFCTNGLDPCAITTTLAPSLASQYSAFGSACSSWLVASASAIVELSQQCPNAVEEAPEQLRDDLFVAGEFASCFGATFDVPTQSPTATASLTSTGTGGGVASTPTSSTTPGTTSSGSAAPSGTGKPNNAAFSRSKVLGLEWASLGASLLFALWGH